MAMTPLALLFLGGMALLATFGVFLKRQLDRETRVLVIFMGAALWGLFGLSSMDVIVRDTAWASASESMDPLVWVGFAMSALTALYGIYFVFKAVGAQAESTSPDSIMGK